MAVFLKHLKFPIWKVGSAKGMQADFRLLLRLKEVEAPKDGQQTGADVPADAEDVGRFARSVGRLCASLVAT